jgi:hypothetical protein
MIYKKVQSEKGSKVQSYTLDLFALPICNFITIP